MRQEEQISLMNFILEQKHQSAGVEYILAQEDKFAILLVF